MIIRNFLKPTSRSQIQSIASLSTGAKSKFKFSQPRSRPNEEEEHQKLVDKLGVTPYPLMQEIVEKQKENPVFWTDQKLSDFYGINFGRIQAIIRIVEENEEYQENTGEDVHEREKIAREKEERFLYHI